MGKDSPSQPSPPDYAGAAVATAAGNADAARIAAKANRVNQYTPYGNITYQNGVNGDQDQWRMDTTLSPQGQQIFDANQNIQTGLLNSAQSGLNSVQQTLGNGGGIDVSRLPRQMVGADQTGQDAIMARLQPQLTQQRAATENQLANQGLRPGMEAYDNAMRIENQRGNDMLSQAALQGIGIGNDARSRGIQEQAYLADRPLNVVNALRTGNQTQLPQFQQTPNQATTAGPDLLGAANAQYGQQMNSYNAGLASDSSMMGGLMSLGGSALKYAPALFAMSDRRLKSNIVRVGTHPLGIGVYEYDIFGWRECGVMAQEVEQVLPEAVARHASGFKMVNYALLQ